MNENQNQSASNQKKLCSSTKNLTQKNENKKLISFNLKKHDCTVDDFNKNKVDNIIFDEKKHIVAVFKDNLLWNEPTELLRRFYDLYEAEDRIPRIYEYYYENNPIIKPCSFKLDSHKYLEKNAKRKKKLLNEEPANNVSGSEQPSTLFKQEIRNSLDKEDFSCIIYKKHSFLKSFDAHHPELPKANKMIPSHCEEEHSLIETLHEKGNSFMSELNHSKIFNSSTSEKKMEKLKTEAIIEKRKSGFKKMESVASGSYKKEVNERKSSQAKSQNLKNSNSEVNFASKGATGTSMPKIKVKTVLKRMETLEKNNKRRDTLLTSQANFKTTFKNFVTHKKTTEKKMLNLRIERESIRATSIKKDLNPESENRNISKNKSPGKRVSIKLLKTEYKGTSIGTSPEKRNKEHSSKKIKFDASQTKSRNRNSQNSTLKKENSQTSENRAAMSSTRKIPTNNSTNMFSSIDVERKSTAFKKLTSHDLEVIPEVKGMKVPLKLANTPRKKTEDKKKVNPQEKTKQMSNNKTPEVKNKQPNSMTTAQSTNYPSLNINVNFHVNFNVLNSAEKITELSEKASSLIKNTFNTENLGTNNINNAENLFVISEQNEKTPRNFDYNEHHRFQSTSPDKNLKLQDKISNIHIDYSSAAKEKQSTEKKPSKISSEKKPSLQHQNSLSKQKQPLISPSLKKSANTMSRNKINTKNLFLFSEKEETNKIITATFFDQDKTFSKKPTEPQSQNSFQQNKTFTSLISPKAPKMSNKLSGLAAKIFNKADSLTEKARVPKRTDLIPTAKKGKELTINTKFPVQKISACSTVTNSSAIKTEFKKSLKETGTPTMTTKLKFESFKSKTLSFKK